MHNPGVVCSTMGSGVRKAAKEIKILRIFKEYPKIFLFIRNKKTGRKNCFFHPRVIFNRFQWLFSNLPPRPGFPVCNRRMPSS